MSLAGWFLLVNSMTVAAFRLDRHRAKAGEWRVPKQTLLMLATLGGWPGLKVTQLIARRRLHRRPFRVLLDLSSLPFAVLAIFLAAQHPERHDLTASSNALQPAQATSAPTRPEVFTLTRVSATKRSM